MSVKIFEIPDKLDELTNKIDTGSFLYDFLSIYDIPRSTITLLKKSPSKLSGMENQVLLKNKIQFHVVGDDEDLHSTIDDLDKNGSKHNPRFIIVTDFVDFLAIDTKTKETLDIPIKKLSREYIFFLPLAKIEKTQIENENIADVRASIKLAKIYDQIIQDNQDDSTKLEDLDLFLTRLLFCYFAEDTDIFSTGGNSVFTNTLGSSTHESGEDLGLYFNDLYLVLKTPAKHRKKIDSHLENFPYVNGGLFEKEIVLPRFSKHSRAMILDAGKLDWSSINPDIFGSMIQAVVKPEERGNLGMHYTSVTNIMKVLKPLFLDELLESLEKAKTVKKLEELRERIVKIKVFDPACGSGNFLITAYKKLSEIESEIILRARSMGKDLLLVSGMNLNNFYGIEIDHFASEVAKLSLWITQYQVNKLFLDHFGMMKPTLPLRESGQIFYGNSARMSWEEVCPKKESGEDQFKTYVIGNPPFGGARVQTKEQKEDLELVFKQRYGDLDYVSIWFKKLADYIRDHDDILGAFVSTNSVSQGQHVELLWPRVIDEYVEISFAHTSFKWSNLAKGNAGVTCVIIGLRNYDNSPKYLYNEGNRLTVQHISPYLTNSVVSYVGKRSQPISDLPDMVFGNMPNDGGHLILSAEDKEIICSGEEGISKFIKRYVGSMEYIRNINRYCLWITDELYKEAISFPFIRERILLTEKHRLNSKRKPTQTLASIPYKFGEIRHVSGDAIIIPRVSSERRQYLPVGFLDEDVIISDSAQAIYNAKPYVFGIISSRMHMLWVKAVGGRLKTDIRYSSALCYNTFPFPGITEKQKEIITEQVYNILDERERHPEKTIADMYNPDKMPTGLLEAHQMLDEVIEKIYQREPFDNDEERLSLLFKLYEDMIKSEENKI